MSNHVKPHTLFTDYDIHLFRSGKHFTLYEKLGCHNLQLDGEWGMQFAVWAPTARAVSVVGDFNDWDRQAHPLLPRPDGSGIWEGFLPGMNKGKLYKYAIRAADGRKLEKGDPFGLFWEIPPNTSTVTWELDYEWKDQKWMQDREKKAGTPQPMSVYEVHLGSWKKHGRGASKSYTELAEELTAYVKEMGFTHVEFMPVMEHPYFPSWGYQITGYFAPSSRFGTPEEFMYLVDTLHQNDIGVILDWVPSHFPNDAHGLADFDGTHLYDHQDPRLGFHPDWKSCIFNYGRYEVRSFLISNALFWLDKYHADGLRVDAVASMLFLDYSRDEGQWIPNKYGGNENLEAISLLKEFNQMVHEKYPAVVTIAEESTAYPNVSKPVEEGGLGFDQKWMMGWMHDTLKYFKEDPINRKYHHSQITFSLVYAFSERFMLPLSHDEVVHLKGSMIHKMPGDEWQKFANLRTLYAYMFTHPGTQLLFMGGEFGQTSEWSIEKGLDWHLTQYPVHSGLQECVKDLNKLYTSHPALYERQFSPDGYEWIEGGDWEKSVLLYIRKGKNENQPLIVCVNLTPVPRPQYRVGVPFAGTYREVFNSNAEKYGGTGSVNAEKLKTTGEGWHFKDDSLYVDLPPLGVTILELACKAPAKKKQPAAKLEVKHEGASGLPPGK